MNEEHIEIREVDILPQYGKIKYNQGKYGKYDIGIGGEIPLQLLKKFRLKTIGKSQHESEAIVNHGVVINTNNIDLNVRLKSSNSKWVYNQRMTLDGNPLKVRVKAVSENTESNWIECVTGTVRK